jgi:hypothetical protein
MSADEDIIVQTMLQEKIPLTQRGYLALAYWGDKNSIDELVAEERAYLPEGFEDWPVDESKIH